MTHRIEQVNKLIRREVSELLQHEVKDPRLGTFLTVTEVSTSSDLRHAKVFVSQIDTEAEAKEILSVLAAAAGFLRKELAQRLRLRRIPELSFLWDDSIKHGNHILKLIDQVAEARAGRRPLRQAVVVRAQRRQQVRGGAVPTDVAEVLPDPVR